MTQQELDLAQVGSSFEQVYRIGMS